MELDSPSLEGLHAAINRHLWKATWLIGLSCPKGFFLLLKGTAVPLFPTRQSVEAGAATWRVPHALQHSQVSGTLDHLLTYPLPVFIRQGPGPENVYFVSAWILLTESRVFVWLTCQVHCSVALRRQPTAEEDKWHFRTVQTTRGVSFSYSHPINFNPAGVYSFIPRICCRRLGP
jgi:hypothetical protein